MSLAIPRLQGRPYLNFINSLKSVETKKIYRKALRRFMTVNKFETLEDILSLPIQDIENMLVDYLQALKKDDLSSSYINLNFSALKHLFFMNDVRINKEKISRFLGESKKKNVDRGYTTEEIRTILDNCDLRLKVAVLTMVTTSMRIGAVAELTLSCLEKKEQYGVYKFTIYRNTKEESICFCSPHCAEVIDSYFRYRIRAGEHLGSDSPFIREMFDSNDIEQVRKRAKPINKDTLTNILLAVVTKAGIRKINRNYTGRERMPIPINHGSRKWWMGQAVAAKMQPEIRGMLLSHSIGLASAYYRPDESEILGEYMKAIDNGFFSVSEEQRLKHKVEKLEIEKSQIEALALELEKVKQKVGVK